MASLLHQRHIFRRKCGKRGEAAAKPRSKQQPHAVTCRPACRKAIDEPYDKAACHIDDQRA